MPRGRSTVPSDDSTPPRRTDVDSTDIELLELLERVDCPLCPPSIAVNIGATPTDVRVRCRKLHSLGVVDMDDRARNAFTLNRVGEDYLAGNADIDPW